VAVDPIVVVVELFKERYDLSSEEFIELNARYSVLDFIAEVCESFCRTGNEGIIEDIQNYIEKQKLAEQTSIDLHQNSSN
jgi:hypothetical protein